YICNIIVTPILCTVGLVTNCLGVGVLWHDTKQQKMSIYFYLCALTLSDISYLALGLIRIIPEIMKHFDFELGSWIGAETKPTIIYFDIMFSHTTAAMIILMSVERLLALVRPLRVKHSWFAKYPVKLILFCFFCNAMILLPYPICMEVVSVPRGNTTDYFLGYRSDAKEFMDIYDPVQTVIGDFIPFLCLLITNIAIPLNYYSVLKQRLEVLKLPSAQMIGQQTKITSTVIAVSFMYVLLVCPLLVSKTLPFIDSDYSFNGRKKLVFWFLIEISNLFSFINAANDFLLFILVSNHYRTVFKQKYCRCCRRQSSYVDRDPGLSIDNASGHGSY
ncbi:MAG: 7 transmembrane receptor, partial [Candidatus Thiodiazotropha sp.]